MLATGIVGALIVICAKPSGVVQLKASRTDALETAQSVNTFAGPRANALLLAFVYICKNYIFQQIINF